MANYLTPRQTKYEEEKSVIKSIIDDADKQLAEIGVLAKRIQYDGGWGGITIEITWINQDWIFEGINHPNVDLLTPAMVVSETQMKGKYSKLFCNFQHNIFKTVCNKAKIDPRVFTPKQRKEIDSIVNKNWAKVANTFIKKIEGDIKSRFGGTLPNYYDYALSIRSDEKPRKAGRVVPTQSAGNYDIWKIVGKNVTLCTGDLKWNGGIGKTTKCGEDVITSIEKNVSENIYIFNLASGLIFYLSEENYKIPYMKMPYVIHFHDNAEINKRNNDLVALSVSRK